MLSDVYIEKRPNETLEYFDVDPVYLLSGQARSLERLVLFRPGHLGHEGVSRFWNVVSLTLRDIRAPQVQYYVHAFPNLQELSIIGSRLSNPQGPYWNHPEDEGSGVLRALNMAQQSRGGSWTRLTQYQGSPMGLYVLSLAFPISLMQLVDNDADGEEMELDLLQAIIEPATPTHLSLDLPGAVKFLGQGFIDLFAASYSQKIRSLQLVISPIFDEDGNVSMDALLEYCTKILSCLPSISRFTFRLRSIWDEPAGDTTIPHMGAGRVNLLPDEVSLTPFELSIHLCDFEAFARGCLASAASLETVLVGLAYHRTRADCTIRQDAPTSQQQWTHKHAR
ncbi:hypothetical protein C8Q79DRAFT_930526 [Trametes meyenii]|nr:hypothetical protein C8Q79DRAFT_930526 [Trametes meyenii]